MKQFVKSGCALALALSLTSPVFAAGPGGGWKASKNNTMGYALMTPAERAEHQAKMAEHGITVIRGCEGEILHVLERWMNGEIKDQKGEVRIKAGETIALVGATGAGKSTIVNLICRFYEPTGGSIKIDGADYRTRSQLWLQSNIGYVLQEPQLFSGTIADNIRYAEKEATDEQVRKAARLVNAETFILKLEKGYDTQVGEGGNRLSTGEKQLISFARAIIHNPRLFVLDEATSSVDTETEMMIQQAFEKTLHGRTSFIIAHRLSTIRHADRILVIEDGKIAESGSHKELIAERGQYYQLYTTQFREERSMDVLTKKN